MPISELVIWEAFAQMNDNDDDTEVLSATESRKKVTEILDIL